MSGLDKDSTVITTAKCKTTNLRSGKQEEDGTREPDVRGDLSVPLQRFIDTIACPSISVEAEDVLIMRGC